MQNNFREAKKRRIKFVPPMRPTHLVTSFYRIYEAVIFHFHAGLDCYECCWLVLDANHSLHIFFCVRLALVLLGYGEELVLSFFFCFVLQSTTPGQRTEKHFARKRKATVDGDSPGKVLHMCLTLMEQNF